MEQNNSLNTAGQLSSLRDYVGVIRRRKWIVAQAVVIVPAIAFLLSMQQEAVYGSSAEVLLSRQNLALTLTGTADPAANDPRRLAQTQAQLARVPEVAKRVLEREHLTDRSPDALLAQVSVNPRENSDFLVFTVSDRDPGTAARLANAFAREYVAYKRRLDTGSLSRARHEVENEIERLEARGERQSDLYGTLVEKQQQLETIEALQTSNASLVRKATGAGKISPRPKRSAFLGLGLGIVLGLGIAFLLEALDTRVRSADEVERALELPLLARLSAPPRNLQQANRLVMLAGPRLAEAEGFRILRTNFEFFNVHIGARTIMVTSAVGEEGKSTTIANLAVALASAGHKVVLVDLDLRRPMLGRFFRLSNQLDVNDIVEGRAKLVTNEIENDGMVGSRGAVEVITARPRHPGYGELLASEELNELLATLRQRADYVLIDAPPLLLVGDAMQLGAKVDGVVVVARIGVVRRHMLRELRRGLDAVPAAKIGFVITGAEAEHEYKYAYSYGYYNRPISEEQERR